MHARPAARSLTAFASCFSSPVSSFSVCAFLAPAACAPLTPLCSNLPRRARNRRWFYSAEDGVIRKPEISSKTAAHVPNSTPYEQPLSGNSHRRSLSSSYGTSSADEFIARLDPFLPLELRSGTWLENLAGFEGVRSAATLPHLLNGARKSMGINLLSHLSIQLGRLEAFLFLTKALCQTEAELKNQGGDCDPHQIIYQNTPWLDLGSSLSLSQITDSYNDQRFEFNLPLQSVKPPSFKTLEQATGKTFDISAQARKLSRSGISEVWECLGDALIHISQADLELRRKVMPYIYQVLAGMHSHDIVPPSIYQYDSSAVPSALRKPPFLHAMSSRIMAILSDSVWKTVEHEIIEDSGLMAAASSNRGQTLPGATLNPQLRSLDLGVWLELVLWSCVHSGFDEAAVRLLGAVSRVKSRYRWSMMGWEEVDRLISERVSLLEEQNQARSWFKRLASTLEGYSEEPSYFEMPKHTISREVVMVVLDRTLHHRKVVDLSSGSFFNIATKAYEALSDGFKVGLKENTPQRGILDILATTPNDRERDLRAYQVYKFIVGETNDDAPLSESPVETITHSMHGVLLAGLIEAVGNGDLNLSLVWLHEIQSLIDKQKQRAISTFDPETASTSTWKRRRYMETYYQIPLSTLAALLNLTIDAKQLGLASWFLNSEDHDGAIIQPGPDSRPIFQPSLLRYAVAVNDLELLGYVTKSLYSGVSGLSSETISALLECQIMLDRFHNARDLLEHMQKEREQLLSARDIINIACRVLKLESINRDGQHSIDENVFWTAAELLRLVLSRAFVPPRDPSQSPDYTAYRMINQLARIFSTIPGALSKSATERVIESGPSSAPIEIPASSFNLLLKTVTETHGVETAQQLFEIWCQPVRKKAHDESIRIYRSEGQRLLVRMTEINNEKVVVANLETVRIVLKTAVEDLAAFNEDAYKYRRQEEKPAGYETMLLGWRDEDSGVERVSDLPDNAPNKQILEWGIRMYQAMGLDDEAIAKAIPGTLTITDESGSSRHVSSQST